MEYYSAVKAAAMLGVSDKTVRAWITDGTLKAKRLTGSTAKNARYAIPASEVERLQKDLQGNGTSASTDVATSTEKFVQPIELQQLNMVFYAFVIKTEEQLHDIRAIQDALTERLERVEREVEFEDDTSDRVNALAKQLAALDNRIKQLEQQRAMIAVEPSETTKDTSDATEQEKRQNVTTEPNKAVVEKKSAGRPKGVKAKSDPPVPGAIRLVDFAKDHGISYDTIRGHAKYGIGTNKEKLPIFSRPVPGREKTEEQEYWVLPGQEDAVFDYGRRYSTPYAPLPDGYVPFFEFVDRHKVGRNEARKNSLIRVEKGKWLDKGKEITEVLSPSAQRAVWEQFHAIEPKFDSCQQCPHAL